MSSKDKLISLSADARLRIKMCPQAEVMEQACEDPLTDEKGFEFQVVHPDEKYIGQPPIVVVDWLSAEHRSGGADGQDYDFIAVITLDSEVESAENGVLEVTGYCNPKHQTGVIWLRTE